MLSGGDTKKVGANDYDQCGGVEYLCEKPTRRFPDGSSFYFLLLRLFHGTDDK